MSQKEVYKGIEFVRLESLPADEREAFRDWLRSESVIKIMIGNAVVDNCVQYVLYESWHNVHSRKAQVAEEISNLRSGVVPSKVI